MSHNPTFGREKGQCVGVRGWPGGLFWGADIEELPATRRRSSDAEGLRWILKKQLLQLLPQAGRLDRASPASGQGTERSPEVEYSHRSNPPSSPRMGPSPLGTSACFPFIEAFKTLQCNPPNTHLIVREWGSFRGAAGPGCRVALGPYRPILPKSPVRQALFSSSFYRLGSKSQRG